MARFQYDPARLNYTLQQNGREYNLRLSQRSQAIFNTLMHLLPSNWISTVKGPNYSVELSAVATELARLELALQDINTDEYFATVRSDFLYQVVGYMLFNGQLPKLDYSDTEFRKFFIALISIYFQGAVPVAIEDAAKLLFNSLATTYENFLLLRDGASGLDISDEFGFRIDIACADAFPPNTFENDDALRMILDIIRPAHTLYQIRYVFKDVYPSEDIIDTSSWRLDNYYYDDFRAYWDGLRDRDSLGRKLGVSVLAEDHSKDLAPDSGTVADSTLYMNKGPLVKPPQVLQQGTTAVITSPQIVTLPLANILPANVGMYIRLTGSGHSDGTYRILARINATSVQLSSSLTAPDTAILWELVDFRNGQIANSPDDVAVRVNGAPVLVASVNGLLGQIVLQDAPPNAAEIRVDYYWMTNPTVSMMQLNRREFRLNSWNRDIGGLDHYRKYRYNNVLITPASYVVNDLRAPLAQPLQREMHYRAIERRYSVVLNDPTLLLLNAPSHQIAYPQMSRPLVPIYVPYEALTLPENNSTFPWQRKGLGLASVSAGRLTIIDTSSLDPIFWVRPCDLSFPAVFTEAWRMSLSLGSVLEGVFTGVAVGFAGTQKAAIIGYLLDAGVPKLGILVDSAHPELITSWAGDLDSSNQSTGAPGVSDFPVDFDWTILHSYRVLRDRAGTVRVFIDGDVVETLRLTEAELPELNSLNAPFDALEGVFFGALSRPAQSTSVWDFVRYQVQPSNPQQTAASIYVQYEATRPPEQDLAAPWTLVGAHGTETITGPDFLLLDSTSATDAAADSFWGLVDGDFRGFLRFEPMLQYASGVVFDARLEGRTCTHGIAPNAVMAAADDGKRLMQLCFFTDNAMPKFSYGGRVLPPDFHPYAWTLQEDCIANAYMLGQELRVVNATTSTKCVYGLQDLEPVDSDSRVLGIYDYYLESRFNVVSHTSETGGLPGQPQFSGAMFQANDGTRIIGLMLCEVYGIPKLALHSDGRIIGSPLDFLWDDGKAHTYRLVKSTLGDYVSVFVDSVYVGGAAYSSFDPTLVLVGKFTFGSATESCKSALSVVAWVYANAWRDSLATGQKFVGLWKGTDNSSLTGYHLPLKCSGENAQVQGNSLGDSLTDFSFVVPGDYLVIDVGPNKGMYPIISVSAYSLTIADPFPSQPTLVNYRIPRQMDWTDYHRYRLMHNGTQVSIMLDDIVEPLFVVDYDGTTLPVSSVGLVQPLASGLAAFAFGAFDPQNLSQTSWDYVRYGLTKSPTESRIAPHHQVLNQWNPIASPEHLFTDIPHTHTGFETSSTGIPPSTAPDFLQDPNLQAFTVLGDGTPLVPVTQSYETRDIQTSEVPLSQINNIEDILNTDGDFTLNDSRRQLETVVPSDVFYSQIQVIEQDSGDPGLIAPMADSLPSLGIFHYEARHCLRYRGNVLPKDDTSAQTPWRIASENPTQVSTTVHGGVLTYSIGAAGTQSVYFNNTPLPDSPGLETTATFRFRVLEDTTYGLGDTQIRVGLSAPGFTVGLAFGTTPLGERLVLVLDLNAPAGETWVLGSIPFDYLDGVEHMYCITKDLDNKAVQVSIG